MRPTLDIFSIAIRRGAGWGRASVPHASAVLLCAAAFALAGCQSVKVEDNPVFNAKAYAKQPPMTLAVAPLRNGTPYEEAHLMMRRSLYAALAPLGYRDVELDDVDRFVAERAMEQNREPGELDRWHIAQPALADSVVFGELREVSRRFYLVYSSIRVDLRVEMVDTRTKTVTYDNNFLVVNRQFNLPSSWFGIGSSLFTSLWHMRGDQIGTSVAEAANIVAERMDLTIGAAVSEMDSVAKVKVDTRGRHLRAGDTVAVRVEAPPGRSLTFRIGELAGEMPLAEREPGVYEGAYLVRSGDNVKFTYASVTLHDETGSEGGFVFSADEQPFELDTTPPGAYIVDKWGTYPNRRGIALHIAPAKPGTERAERLHVYRRDAGSPGKPQWLGVAEGDEFHDASALAGRRYEYMIVAEDAAGNPGAPEARTVTIPGEVATGTPTP